MLRASRGEASGPRDSASRKSITPFYEKSVFRFRAARSGGGPNGPARRPGGSSNRKSTAHSSSGAGGRARGRRFLAESCYSLLAYSNSPPAGSATSLDELQSAAWGGGELRGSKSRKSSANNSARFAVQNSPPILSGSTCRPSPPERQSRWATGPTVRRTALLALSSSGRSLRGPKRAWRVAGLRGRRLRPARLCESQEHSPKLPPVLRPVSASLRLRWRSAAFCRRPRQFLPDWPSANRQNMPSLSGRARPQGVLLAASALFSARGPHLERRGNTDKTLNEARHLSENRRCERILTLGKLFFHRMALFL